MAKGTVLVAGGAGYVGSHAAIALLEAGYGVVVVDDLSTGWRDAVPEGAVFIDADIGDRAMLADVMRGHRVVAVMHFAGSIVTSESLVRPLDYYRNNTVASLGLIAATIDAGVRVFLFSSTAAVYGMAKTLPIPESAPLLPITPYGASKLMTERMLGDAAEAHGLRHACLRYFNVAGADPAGRAGQSSRNATHLLKIACQTALGARAGLTVHGDDYPTTDGTCIRDYIHVTDLVEAHLLTLAHLLDGGGPLVANCGYGHGYSVRQILEGVAAESGRCLPVTVGPRRPGDPPELVADAGLLRRTLGWRPRHDDLRFIIRTALAWEQVLVARYPLRLVG